MNLTIANHGSEISHLRQTVSTLDDKHNDSNQMTISRFESMTTVIEEKFKACDDKMNTIEAAGPVIQNALIHLDTMVAEISFFTLGANTRQ